VVRLKGGDPFVFGRGGEEARACDEAGVTWRVVPGISAGMAAPAAAGIPLTHRGVAVAITFVTAHDEAGGLPPLDFAALAGLGGTIAAFMALSRLDELALRLLAAGRDPATPVAIISRASLPGQAVLRSTLGACTLAAKRAAMPTPGAGGDRRGGGLALGLPHPTSARLPGMRDEDDWAPARDVGTLGLAPWPWWCCWPGCSEFFQRGETR
jgi:uroporphyrin-III C-methyltransferase